MKNSILFIILSVCLLSCQHTGDSSTTKDSTIETIPVFSNYTAELPFSAFVDTIELIPLETTEDNLIGEITRVIFNNGKYYIRSTNSMQNAKLFVFDENGKYLQKISKQGGGPEEYIEFKDFTMTNDNQVVIADYQKLLYFDSDGNFSHSNKINQSFSATELLATKENDILVFLTLPNLFQNYLISKIDKEGNQNFFFNPGEKEALKCNFRTIWRAFGATDSSYYLAYPFCDTIYSISSDLRKITRAYYIDYGDKKIPNIPIDSKDDCLSWQKKLNRLDDYAERVSTGISDNFLYIGIIDKARKGYLSLYSKRSKKILTAKKLVDDMYLKGNIIPVTAKRIPHNMDGNDIIWEIEPNILLDGYQQLSTAEREVLKQKYPAWYKVCSSLKEDDNPVLLRIKVKDF